MIRGLFSGLQFTCLLISMQCTTKWPDISCLVEGCVGYRFVVPRWFRRLHDGHDDGFAANRQFIDLHAPRGNAKIVYKVNNPYSTKIMTSDMLYNVPTKVCWYIIARLCPNLVSVNYMQSLWYISNFLYEYPLGERATTLTKANGNTIRVTMNQSVNV